MTIQLHIVQNNKPKNGDITPDTELEALLVQCQKGDKTAFARLYQQSAARLNGIAYRITRNIDSANEVLQEAFIQIWQNCQQYHVGKCKAFPWLASIVRYRAYDRVKYDKRRCQQDMHEFDENIISNEELAYYSEQFSSDAYPQQVLHSCLEKLEQKQRQSILMAYIYGYTRDDISEHFNTPVNTIKSWIRRGLRRLQLCLNQ